MVPAIRVRLVRDRPIDLEGRYVLYWMTAFRRVRFNFALEQAVDRARELHKPLVILEALRSDHRWASERFHRFLVDGMRDNASALARKPVLYYPYVERKRGAGKGLFRALAKRAALVIGDDYPCFFLPRMIAAAAEQCPVQMEVVDSNGLLPLYATDRAFKRAVDFRRYLAEVLPQDRPKPDPLRVQLPHLARLPEEITRRWASGTEVDPAKLPIDHRVAPVELSGGHSAARKRWRSFLTKLHRYPEARNHPDEEATSGLSPWLHFGHISTHELEPDLDRKDEAARAFADQLITWRELGFNTCAHRQDYDRYDSLPEWALTTLDEHRLDPRDPIYELEALESAVTHDPIWNAAQRELVETGRLHNYLRMLWGKKIVEWSPSPERALEIMIELNNKYALDGRDPNSYSGIFWILGRYDRPWGPERPIFGTVRYMSSESTKRKLRMKRYLARFSR